MTAAAWVILGAGVILFIGWSIMAISGRDSRNEEKYDERLRHIKEEK